MSTRSSIRAHPRYLIATDAASLLLVEALLFALSRVPLLISPLAWVLLSVLAAAVAAVDVGFWFWRGIRMVELDESTLTLYRGPSLEVRSVHKAEISRLTPSRVPGGRRVTIRLSGGGKARIPEGAFAREEFTRFLAELAEWRRR